MVWLPSVPAYRNDYECHCSGPLLISTPRLYAFGCALLLLVSSRYLLGYPQHGRWFNGLLVVWLLGARVAFVALNWESYSATPLDALKCGSRAITRWVD